MDADFYDQTNRMARVALVAHNRPMLSATELSSSHINAEVAREAYAHASAMLDDVLQNRKDIEQKCFILLAGYLPLSAAIYGQSPLTIPAKIAMAFVVGGIVALLTSFYGMKYPARGTSPRAWIAHGIIDGREDALAHTLAHLTRQMADKIDVGIKANARKIRLLNAAGMCGVLAIAAQAIGKIAN